MQVALGRFLDFSLSCASSSFFVGKPTVTSKVVSLEPRPSTLMHYGMIADHADRGGQTGSTLESVTGRAAGPRAGARTSQPRHSGRGAQTGRLSAGRRQKRAGLPTAQAVASAGTKSCLRRKNSEPSGDRPAVPRQLGNWGRGASAPDAPYRLYRGRPE